MIAILSALLPLTTVFVGLRFYSRKYHQNDVGLDDWVLLSALVSLRVLIWHQSRCRRVRRISAG